ncbi:MAG TPA: sigma-70 family RNA polymerase sigma factor [Streptosporangiaceae bacterium]|jgi:RNA polymerase sigma-70 factor (ECF subfamily)|nr:sigma-70 family RNA polymerase sigma factor [Streptosporangiaceae bacterium]
MRSFPDDWSDADLLRLEQADAFAAVYDRHVARVYSWSAARAGDYAADLTAEVFAQAWAGRRRFKDEANGSALPWLLGIARNVLRASLRKRQVEISARSRLGLPVTSFEERGYEAVEERLSFPSAVVRAVESLPSAERQLLVLRLVEDRPYREIALLLNCTPVAARLRFSRTLRRLSLALGGYPS